MLLTAMSERINDNTVRHFKIHIKKGYCKYTRLPFILYSINIFCNIIRICLLPNLNPVHFE